MAHHIDGVNGLFALGNLIHLNGRNAGHHFICNAVCALGPGVDDLVVLFALRDEAVNILLLIFLHEITCLVDQLFLGFGNDHVILAEGNACLESVIEAERHDAVAKDNRLFLATMTVDGVDHARDFALGQKLVAGFH